MTTKLKPAERKQVILKHWHEYSNGRLAYMLGVCIRTIEKDKQILREAGIAPAVKPFVPPPEPEPEPTKVTKQKVTAPPKKPETPRAKELVKTERMKEHLRHERKSVKKLAREVIDLNDRLEAALKLTDTSIEYTIPHAAPKQGTEAVAVMVASDWHIEAVVEAHQVSGLNSFNADVARVRVERFFRHGVALLKQAQQSTTIDTLILALIGDMISGSIHDELLESNRKLPVDAIIEAQEYLSAGINYILAHTDVCIVVPCKSGNHGRMTAKRRISTEDGNSLEKLLYHSLKLMFKDEPRVTVMVEDGYHTYINVWPNFVLRLHHGHSTRYNGGSGGVSIPLNKSVLAWNRGRKSDLDILGHFHQFLDGGSWLINGSLIGYDAYALSIKASPEPPRQAFLLIDRDVGKTLVCPIILDRDR